MIRTPLIALALGFGLVIGGGLAAEELPLSRGQAVYVPVYSHVLHGNADGSGKPGTSLFSVMLSIRNTDATDAITVRSVQYYDTAGKLLREYYAKPTMLGPMASAEIFVEYKDAAGGSGANFLLSWDAEKAVNPPMIEAVHANLFGSTGAIFAVRGQPIRIDKR